MSDPNQRCDTTCDFYIPNPSIYNHHCGADFDMRNLEGIGTCSSINHFSCRRYDEVSKRIKQKA